MAELTVYSVADTAMKSLFPTTNYGTDDNFWVGDGSSDEFNAGRILVKFDLTSILGATVSAVVFSLYEYAVSNTSTLTSWAVNLNRLLRNWVETEVTWNIYSTGNNWATAGAAGADTDIDSDISATLIMDSTPAGAYVDWSGAVLLDDVQKIASGVYTNYGWRVRAPDPELEFADHCYNRFYSREKGTVYRPRLVVTYTPPVVGRSQGYIIG